MADKTITIRAPTLATMDVDLRLTRSTVDGVTKTQVTATAIVDGYQQTATWDPTDDVAAVKSACRDFFLAVLASAKTRWGF